MHTITLIPADSPAVTDATRRILEATGVPITWDVHELEDGEPSDALVASVRKNRTALMGFKSGQRTAGKPAPIVLLRRRLGVFANVRPAHAVPGIPTRFPDTDLVVIRETTEDIYAGLEHESIPGTFESLKVTTRAGCERIARYAFARARATGRRRVTIVHKANIMKKSDGMFLATGREIAADFPDIAVDDCIVDALCMKLVRDPTQFDVLLCGNLFGDIVADLAAGLVGGRPNAPSMNVGEDGIAVFTTGHGDVTTDEGTALANPTSLSFSGVLLLRHLGEDEAADRTMHALQATLEAGVRPPVVGGTATAEAFADAVISRL